MKTQLLITLTLGVLFALTGCEKNQTGTSGTYPPSGGDFVRNIDGLGHAKVWGIHFEVAEPVGESAGSTFEGGLDSDPEQTDARIEVNIGDDVSISLEKIPGSPISFHFKGNSYGILEIGDEVVIDKERNVEVNGSPRTPQE